MAKAVAGPGVLVSASLSSQERGLRVSPGEPGVPPLTALRPPSHRLTSPSRSAFVVGNSCYQPVKLIISEVGSAAECILGTGSALIREAFLYLLSETLHGFKELL